MTRLLPFATRVVGVMVNYCGANRKLQRQSTALPLWDSRTSVYGLKHQKEKRSMDHFAGLDVSVKETSVCIVDDTGRIVREVKVAS
jgi:phosphoribosylaminoimidazole carboxylase (NCAIR synthetase)